MGRLDGLLGKTEECGKEGERVGGKEGLGKTVDAV